ncbi:hypothetical protein G9A89_022903 [Geosiphon pyriformis]|nr:hypothetical protein G9A89_022903 [Geosiphon pyriformis]
MPEYTHNINPEFDLRYLGKVAIKLKPHLCICIDLKVALEIPATTIVQLASRSSLAKKEINIRRGIINAEYIENIIAMLQNNSEKTYIIDPNKKIAQAIFLPLVKIAQLVSVENRKKLEITARGIQKFRSISRIDVPINMVKEEIIDKEKISFTFQIFETETTLYESKKIGLVNLYIPAKNHSHIKIFIYNNIENIIKILEGITIEYLTTKIEDQLPDTIPDFSQLC